jgi:hypothetical protein
MNELETAAQRQEAAKPFIAELVKLAPKATPAGFGLLEIDPNTLDLLEFRMECLERLAALQADPEAIEARADVVAELDAADREIRKLCGSDVAKVDQFANLWRALEMVELNFKDKRDLYSRKAKRVSGILEWLGSVAMEALTIAGVPRFDSPNSTLRIQRNPPRVEITDAQTVPDRFVTVTLEIPADRYKQLREAQPELIQWVTEKERGFKIAEIGKVLKAAAAKRLQQEENVRLGKLPGEKIDTVRGAELRSTKRLVVE